MKNLLFVAYALLLMMVTSTQSSAAPGPLYVGQFSGNGGGLTNLTASALRSNALPFVTVGPVANDGSMFNPGTLGTTTSGIQEAIDSLYTNSSWTWKPAGGELKFAPGEYHHTSQIKIPDRFPFQLTVKGAGRSAVLINYRGTVAQDAWITVTNPSRTSIFEPTKLTLEDCTFTYESNFTKYIFNIGGAISVHANRCTFSRYIPLISTNISEFSGVTNASGPCGFKYQPQQNLDVDFSDNFFYGLATGLYFAGDHIRLRNNFFLCVGLYSPDNGATYVYSNLWTTGYETLGAGLVYDSTFGDCFALHDDFSACGLAVAMPNRGPGVAGFFPLFNDVFFGTARRFATYGNSAQQGNGNKVGAFRCRGSFFVEAADYVITNNAAGGYGLVAEPSSDIYDISPQSQFLSFGSSNATFSSDVLGNVTNAQRFSALGGSALFNATVTTTTNYILLSGAGTAAANGKYYRTNGAYFGAASSTWTNPVTGAFIVDDPNQVYNQNEVTELYNSAATSIYTLANFSIWELLTSVSSLMGSWGVSGGASPAPSAVYLSTRQTLSNPTVKLPPLAENFNANDKYITNVNTLNASNINATGIISGNAFAGTGAGPTRFDMWDADHSNFMSEQANPNITGNYTNVHPAAAATGLFYGTALNGIVTWSQVTIGAGLTLESGTIKTNGQTVAGASFDPTATPGISNGIYGIKISSTAGVGIGMANEGYGPGSLELLTDLVIGQDANIGRNAFISGSGYIGIGNRTAFRADGNGQLRIFAANASSAGGPGADVFLGTTTATNGFITVTNSAQTLSAITFPATTVKWTNNFGMNILLYIDNSGVTGTSVSKNNQQIFSSLVGDMTIGLKPGDYFAVAYTIGTPVARWEPQ